MTNRWWTYQKERFPILAHGPMVVVFCLAVLLFSSLQHGGEMPDPGSAFGAIVSTLILFFQLRVADEFKDYDLDSRYRPHRPVPRGLVSVRELARLAVAGAVIQFTIAVSIDLGLVPILLLVWIYIGLMTKEFFVRKWLLAHPAAYLLSHMLVMPLIAFYASAFDWLCECRAMPHGMTWLLLLSFCCGLVLELGRKIRVPSRERFGVETYSVLWGGNVAVILWLAAVSVSVLAYAMAAAEISSDHFFVALGACVVVVGLFSALKFAGSGRLRIAGNRNILEPTSGFVALSLYSGLGPMQALLA